MDDTTNETVVEMLRKVMIRHTKVGERSAHYLCRTATCARLL